MQNLQKELKNIAELTPEDVARISTPAGKKRLYPYLLEKLDITLSFYTRAEFAALKFYKLNVDQLCVFMNNENFLVTASPEKVVEALCHMAKQRSLQFYDRPDI